MKQKHIRVKSESSHLKLMNLFRTPDNACNFLIETLILIIKWSKKFGFFHINSSLSSSRLL